MYKLAYVLRVAYSLIVQVSALRQHGVYTISVTRRFNSTGED